MLSDTRGQTTALQWLHGKEKNEKSIPSRVLIDPVPFLLTTAHMRWLFILISCNCCIEKDSALRVFLSKWFCSGEGVWSSLHVIFSLMMSYGQNEASDKLFCEQDAVVVTKLFFSVP